MLAETGASVCFLINGISYLAVLIALLAMRLAPQVMSPSRERFARGTTGRIPLRIPLLNDPDHFADMLHSKHGGQFSYNVILPEYFHYGFSGHGSLWKPAYRICGRNAGHFVRDYNEWLRLLGQRISILCITTTFARVESSHLSAS
ncbi:MAG: hypothetical protein PHD43_13085 [Methylococcales bacterium]|nr:hypothetical protein [Methylococcales bacterium]